MLKFTWILVFIAVSGVSAEAPQDNGDVEITKHPYMVSIRKNGKHVCSGAILDKYRIITSDRCVPPFKHSWNIMNGITVFTGTSSLKTTGRPNLAKEMFSQNRNVNPNKNPVTSGIGIIKLIMPIQFGKTAQPIKLSTSELSPGTEIQMVGWLIENSEEKKNLHLKEAPLEVVDHEKCQSFHTKTITDTEFCTQSKSSRSFCKGESGSPLVYEGNLVGFATYGISCEDTLVPDVHTNTNNIREYLADPMKD